MALEENLKNIGSLISSEFENSGQALVKDIEKFSKEKAAEVKEIVIKIGLLLADLADPKNKKVDEKAVNMAIKTYRQAIRSKAKEIQNFVQYESYKTFWAFVKKIIGFVVFFISST